MARSQVVVAVLAGGIAALGCARSLPLQGEVIHARFDPEAQVVPMPTDLLRDDEAGHLALPADDPALTPAEAELYAALNEMDGWSTISVAEVELTDVVEGASVHSESVQVWVWMGEHAERVEDATVHLDASGTHVQVDPPPLGWPRGATVVVMLRGGENGVRGARGQRVVADAAFYFLRLTEDLTAPEHNYAFPGDTPEQRAGVAEQLEEIREELAPYFDFFEARGVPRSEVASLWTFTTTQRTELAMDKTTARMPLPVDLLIDPSTGLVDLPAQPEDTELETSAKAALNRLDGFGPTMAALFEATAPLDPATVTPETVQLIDTQTGAPVESTLEISTDLRRVRLTPLAGELEAEHIYAVVLRAPILDSTGAPVVAMPLGRMLMLSAPVEIGGVSELGAASDEDAVRIEVSRSEVAGVLDGIGREQVVGAWPYRTMAIVDPLLTAQQASSKLAISPDPDHLVEVTPTQAILDFPLSALTLFDVDRVYHGTIQTVDYLDPVTRARRADGGYEIHDIPFTMTIPKSAQPGTPVPVVVFGHGLMAERRFVLGIADALAHRGFAAISIDFPYHGDRTVCKWNGPICFPDPIAADGSLICPNPCPSNATCAADGACYDDDTGAQTDLSRWPVISMYQASGAAFVDVEDIPATRDHFFQAVTDLGALSYSLRHGDWESAVGVPIDTSQTYYVGQSLGGIMGGLYTPTDPTITRAVLNVPGANLVKMFEDSTLFGGHIDAFRIRHDIEPGSAEDWKFFSIAHWLVDGVDPINVARYLESEPMPGVGMPPERDVFIQMALLDIIIPNESTERLEAVSNLPRRDYVATHSFLTVPIEPEFIRGTIEMGDFVDGDLQP